ncbi:MAG: hypothetical protein AAF636_10570 [Pseudomonadota bacterium]
MFSIDTRSYYPERQRARRDRSGVVAAQASAGHTYCPASALSGLLNFDVMDLST